VATIEYLNATPSVADSLAALVIAGIAWVVVVTVMASLAVPVPLALVAPMVTLDVPAAVGVPLITPVVALMESPAGRPGAEKLVGQLFAAIVYWNDEPTAADSLVALVMTGTAWTLTAMASLAVPVPLALVAPMVTLDVPAAVGVPLITPVDVFMESPAGSPGAEKLVGQLLAAIEYWNDEPTAADALVALVMTGAG
jgi:uncharacterized protein YhfF